VRAARGELSPGPEPRPLTLVIVTHDRSLAGALGGIRWALEAGRLVT
jgi:hypothetical protein